MKSFFFSVWSFPTHLVVMRFLLRLFYSPVKKGPALNSPPSPPPIAPVVQELAVRAAGLAYVSVAWVLGSG